MKTNFICTVRGIESFEAPDATCLNVRVGTYYVITKQGDPSWWCGREVQNGLVSGSVGLVPSDHVEVVGSGLVLPGLEPSGTSRKAAKKKASKKSHSSTSLARKDAVEKKEASEAAALASAEVFAKALADKQAEVDALARKLEGVTKRNGKLKVKLADSKKREVVLRGQFDCLGKTCLRCGADIGGDKDVAAKAVVGEEGNENDGMDLLVRQGYDLQVLTRFKALLRSVVMRRRFRKVAMDFKSHKASLVMRLRNESLREILSSEQKYVDSLQLAIDEFQRPMLRLAASRQNARVVTRSDVSDIFSTLEIIVELNRGLLTELKERLAQWPSVQRFGDLFIRMSPILRLYSGYVRNFDVAQRTLLEKRETSSAFVEFLEEAEKRTGGHQLESYLIMPIQRIPRYQMLLSGLLKYTDSMHIDFADISLAHSRIIEICHEINFQKSVDDNCRVMRLLFDEVDGLAEALGSLCESSGSYFVHRGELHSIKGASVDSFYYFLFSNGLVRALPTKKKIPAWVVADVIPLSAVVAVQEIPDMSGIANGFEITIKKWKGEGFKVEKNDVLALCSLTTPEKSMWMTKIGAFLERWHGGEEGARALLDASVKLLEEFNREQQHNSSQRGGREGLIRSSTETSQTPVPMRLIHKTQSRLSSKPK